MNLNRNHAIGAGILVLFISIGFWLSNTDNSRTNRDKGKVNSVSSSEHGKSNTKNSSIENKVIDESMPTVNFFLENSGSMDGYLRGSTSLVQNTNRIVRDLELESFPIQTFYINTKVYPSKRNINEFLSSLNVKGIKGYGDRGNSDINFMFSEAIKASNDGNVSILISDGIYSLEETSKENLVNALQTEKFKTRKQIVEAANSYNLMTVLVKMSSNFNGNYYTATGKTIPINQERPYYIWLFGSPENIEQVLKSLKITELEGYLNQARFIRSSKLNIRYSILTSGKEKIGNFRKDRSNPNKDVHEVVNSERAERGKKVGYFGFGLAVDFSKILISEDYLLSTINYDCKPEGYSINSIKAISKDEPPKSTMNLDFIPTHIVCLETKSSYLGEKDIALLNNVPAWISSSSNQNDSQINGDTETTFGFEVLIDGIKEAYEKLNNDQSEIVKFSIKIKP